MVYTAGAGANNAVVLDGAELPVEVLLSDPGASRIHYRRNYCEPTKVDKQLLCDAAPEGNQIHLRDGDDSLVVANRYPNDLPLQVDCGDGQDRVEVFAT